LAKYSKRDDKMFKKLKSLFSKKSEVKAGITVYVEDDGQVYVDVRIVDDSDETVECLASLICMYSPSAFFQVTSVIKTQLESAGKQELYVKIIEKAAGMITFDQEDINAQYSEEPCINPSDMI
tara:strand:- start:1780 stop:2148 length:369 start_codon:yes stop_codon:yes gene_type:complete